jgi:hypothetical protein
MKTAILIALVLLATPAEAQERRSRKPLTIGVTCSVVANALDAHSTWYALHDPTLGLVEGNVLGAYETDSWKKLLIAKVPVTVGTNLIAIHIYDEHPRWSNLLTYVDCALKGATSIRNYVLANQARDRQRARIGLSMKVSW